MMNCSFSPLLETKRLLMDQLLQCKVMLNTISFLIDQLPFAHMDHVIIGQRGGPKLDQGKCEASVCPQKTIPRLLCNFRVYFSSNRGLYINNLLSLQLRKIHTNHINQCLLTASSTKDNPSDLV